MKETIGEAMFMESFIKSILDKANKYLNYPKIIINGLSEFTVQLCFYIPEKWDYATKYFRTFAELEEYLDSLETYKVGDRLQVGENTYLICCDNCNVFLINLASGRKYGMKITRGIFSDFSRDEVVKMLNWNHTKINFHKI